MTILQVFQPKQISKRLKSSASCGLAVAAALTMWAAPEAASAQTKDIFISAPDLTLTSTDTSVTVPLTLDAPDTASVGGFQFNLEYDSSKLTVASCTPTLGLFGNCNSGTAGIIRANGISLSPIANGEIYNIVFDVVNGATGTSALDLTVTEATQVPSVADLTARADAIDGSVGIEEEVLAEMTIQRTSISWNAASDDSNPDAVLGYYDANFNFTNSGTKNLHGLYFQVTEATNSTLLNADGDNKGVGGIYTVPLVNGQYAGNDDDTLNPTELFSANLQYGVNAKPWKIKLDLWAVDRSGVNADPAPVATISLDSSMFGEDGEPLGQMVQSIFIPVFQ